MRLWHQKLIHYLDNRRLLGQHRECCALRGKGWKKKHSVVDYVFKHDLMHLYQYHRLVMIEMESRNYKVDELWYDKNYRGKSLDCAMDYDLGPCNFTVSGCIYKEHDNNYLRECLLNLKSKGAHLTNGASIEQMLVELDLNEQP